MTGIQSREAFSDLSFTVVTDNRENRAHNLIVRIESTTGTVGLLLEETGAEIVIVPTAPVPDGS
jgi:hypothetical protein